MAGRFDLRPFYTNYLILLTTVLAIVGWFVAFLGMAIAESKKPKGVSGDVEGTAWFSIFLHLFLILTFLSSVARDTLALYQLQLTAFLAVGLVGAVDAVNGNIFSDAGSQEAAGAGWLLLSIVDIIWLLILTSHPLSTPASLMLSLSPNSTLSSAFSSLPSHSSSTAGINRSGSLAANGAPISGYSSGGIGSKMGGGGAGISSHDLGGNGGQGMPLMMNGGAGRSQADLSVGGGGGGTDLEAGGGGGRGGANAYPMKAKAMYAYQGSADDPQEISFSKGEMLEIADNSGKWWSARKADGQTGIAPSNYLQLM